MNATAKTAWVKIAAVALAFALALVACAVTATHAEAKVITGKTSSGLVYTRYTASGQAYINGYKGKSSKVTIPATIHGAKVVGVTLTHKGLTSVNVTNAKYMTSLRVEYNRLKSLNITKNKRLQWLWCSENKLKTLNVSKNPKLGYVAINWNPLTSSAKASLRKWGKKSGHILMM